MANSLSQFSLFGSGVPVLEQYHDDARVVLYPGETRDFLASIPDGSVKLMVTSPPYNVGKEYEVKSGIEEYLDHQEAVIRAMHRKLRDDGSICWQVGNYGDNGEIFPLDIFYYRIFKERLGMRLRNRIVWHFGHGLHATKRFSGRYKVMLWFTKGDNYTFNLDSVRVPSKYPGKTDYKPGPNYGRPTGNPLGKNPSDIWQVMAQEWEEGLWDVPNCKSNHPEKTQHPAQFPIEVAERCVLAFTNERDWVLDPYAGVGSTLLAAMKNSRRAMGAERHMPYVELARERIRLLQENKLPMRAIGTPVHAPTGREKVAQPPALWAAKE